MTRQSRSDADATGLCTLDESFGMPWSTSWASIRSAETFGGTAPSRALAPRRPHQPTFPELM